MAAIDISKVGNHVKINDRLMIELPSFIEIGKAPGGSKMIVIKFKDTAFVDDPVLKIAFDDLTINGLVPASLQDALASLSTVFPSVSGGITLSGGGGGSIGDNTITNAKLATDIKIGSLASLTTSNKSSMSAALEEVKGIAVSAATGSTPPNSSITNIKLANMPPSTIKGYVGSAPGIPQDLNGSQVKVLINLDQVSNVPDASKMFVASQVTDLSAAVDMYTPVRAFDGLYVKGDGVGDPYIILKADKVAPKVQSISSASVVTPNADTDGAISISSQNTGLTLANWAGSPVDMQEIIARVNDNGTPQSISYGTQYRPIGVTLPSITVANKTLYYNLRWNARDSKVDVTVIQLQA
jgi:hypothetical protein